MSYISMAKELQGDIPGLPLPKAQIILNEALLLIYDEQRWSFQVAQNGWLTPGLLGGLSPDLSYQSPGRITVVPFSNTVYGDAVATAVWATQIGRPFITEQQIRVPAYSLYNIISYFAPGDNPEDPDTEFATLILDRLWLEPAQTNAVYMIYQAYFATGSETFRKFGTIRDTTNNAWVNYWEKDQAWLSVSDPQRTIFDIPRFAVPWQRDHRLGSATFNQMLYELWPHPLSKLPYTYTYLHQGPLLKLPTDTVPWPLNEELVKLRAKEEGFLWKESQKGDGLDRGSGADWRFLAQEKHEAYGERLKTVKLLDAGLGDLYWTKFNRIPLTSDGYQTVIGTLNIGRM